MRGLSVLLWAALIYGGFVSCGASSSTVTTAAVVLGPETCTNGIDDNGDGKIDCFDPKCIDTSGCAFGEICDNARDDNSNRLVDCADPQCEGQGCGPSCLCVGGAKQVFNGAKDAGRPDAGSSTRDAGSPTRDAGLPVIDSGTMVRDAGTPMLDAGLQVIDAGVSTCSGCSAGCSCVNGVKAETNCLDAADNDQDTAADCADSDCSGQSCGTGCVCVGTHKKETACTDGLDNNGLGGTDCFDSDCIGQSCGTGCMCVANHPKETVCADHIDNNGMGGTDCADPDCAGVSCGAGCQCVASSKKEVLCADTADNDGDGLADCADPDCVGVGTEICDDGIDNTCDRAIDCGDTKCTGTAKCTNVGDGLPCTANKQCAGGKCFSELGDGAPNGMCSNLASCTLGTNAGCHGGFCLAAADNSFHFCRTPCIGRGLTEPGKCRVGYACYDPDPNATAINSYCTALCTKDSECSASGAGYGCNLSSKRCESKVKGLLGYGAACSSPSQCEGRVCLIDASHLGGYCSGPCRNDLTNCASGGYCDKAPNAQDNVSTCLQSCSDFGMCRRPDRYGCWKVTPRQTGTACQCLPAGANFENQPTYGDTCCSGTSTGTICN